MKIISLDAKGFKKVLEREFKKGYVDNLMYIEILDWIKKYETKIKRNTKSKSLK